MLTTYVSPSQLCIDGNTLSWSVRRFYIDNASGTITSSGLINLRILYLKSN